MLYPQVNAIFRFFKRVYCFTRVCIYLYYMAIEILLKNDDWPENNQKLFRPKTVDGKWRWILQNLDNTMKTSVGDKLGDLLHHILTSSQLK